MIALVCPLSLRVKKRLVVNIYGQKFNYGVRILHCGSEASSIPIGNV